MKTLFNKIIGSTKATKPELDEFTQRILCSVPGMLETGNLESFEFVADNISSKNPCIEIGSFCGLSSILMRYFLDKNNKPNRIFTCDNWSFEGFFDNAPDKFKNKDFDLYLELVGNNTNISRENYTRFIKNQFKNNTLFFSSHNLPASFHLSSDIFFSFWDEGSAIRDIFGNENRLGGKVSFVYIDGGHSYGQCKNDFNNADKYLEKGGYLLLDDSADGGMFGSTKVAQEINKSLRYRVVKQNPNYLFQKVN